MYYEKILNIVLSAFFVTTVQTLKKCERFEPRSHFKSRLSLIVRVNVILNRTVVVDSDWRFDNLCAQKRELWYVLVSDEVNSNVLNYWLTVIAQGQWVGSEEKAGRKFSSTGERAPGYRALTELFPKIQTVPGSWLGTKNALYYCAQSANSLSWVLFVSSYTTAILFLARFVWLMHQRNARSQETFSLI